MKQPRTLDPSTAPGLFLVEPRQRTRQPTLTEQALEIAARIPFEQFATDVGESAWTHFRLLIERLDKGTLSLDERFSELGPNEIVMCLVYSSIKDEATGEVRNRLAEQHALDVVERWITNTGPQSVLVKPGRSKGGAI